MKKLKTNLLLIIALVIGAVAMSFALVNGEKPKTKTSVQWRYIGTSTAEGQFRQVTNWEPGAGVGCMPAGNLPCQLTSDAEDRDELAIHLSGLTNDAVMALVDSQKN